MIKTSATAMVDAGNWSTITNPAKHVPTVASATPNIFSSTSCLNTKLNQPTFWGCQPLCYWHTLAMRRSRSQVVLLQRRKEMHKAMSLIGISSDRIVVSVESERCSGRSAPE